MSRDPAANVRQRVLLVGGGAREHALAWALRSHDLLIAPGNAGTAMVGRNVPVAATDVAAIVELAVREKVDLVVVGPEAPLSMGLADQLRNASIRVFGPSQAAAQLESSKVFMKEFLKRHGIATAPFEVFDCADKAKAYVRAQNRPLVVKADGLCAGKGVVVASSVDEAIEAIDRLQVGREFGEAGAKVIIEEILPGDEASFHVVCDGARAVCLVPAQDHKRVHDGDRGPNTGGMGAYAPAPVVTPQVHERVVRDIVEPTLSAMAAEGRPFQGVLFVGLMISDGQPSVLEFNVRFGDPETTVLVPMYAGDWFELLDGAARGDLSRVHAQTRPGAALSVVMAAEGYPGPVTTGDPIGGLGQVFALASDPSAGTQAFVFHAGTRHDAGSNAVVTAGGRVLAVCAYAPTTLAEARDEAYAAVARVHWRGEHHRSDIGHRALVK